MHRNSAKLAHSTDAVALQIESIAANEKAPDGLTFSDREGVPTTIYDFEGNEMDLDDDISDGEFEAGSDKELEDDHIVDDDDYNAEDVPEDRDPTGNIVVGS